MKRNHEKLMEEWKLIYKKHRKGAVSYESDEEWAYKNCKGETSRMFIRMFQLGVSVGYRLGYKDGKETPVK